MAYNLRGFILFITLSVLASLPAYAGDTARVLFIGNSFTGVNDLPEQTRLLAESKGDVLIKSSQTIGGATLQMYSTHAATLSLIDQGGWDVVVFQEQSQRPAFPSQQVEQDVYPYARILSDRVGITSPCAKVMFYMTWGYRNGDASNCAGFPPICTYNGMDSLLRTRYKAMSDSNNALLCSVGGTWRRIRNQFPAINLYALDEMHPSIEGTYAAACSFYSSLFQKSPVGASYIASLNTTDAANIQNAAKAVVYDSLTYWNQWWSQSFAPVAGFTSVVSGKTVQLTNLSQSATMYNWDFGDGNSSTAVSPSHTYVANGTYSVQLIAKSACGNPDTVRSLIQINAVSAHDAIARGKQPHIFPNPVKDIIRINNLAARHSIVQIWDSYGRLVSRHFLPAHTETFEIDARALKAGVYYVVITDKAGNSSTVSMEKVE